VLGALSCEGVEVRKVCEKYTMRKGTEKYLLTSNTSHAVAP